MANLRTAMDAAFWDVNISTSRTLDGISRAVPGERIPLDGARASRVLRVQQLSFLRQGFPLGIIPTFSPPANHKELGSFALQAIPAKVAIGSWWVGLIGQLRPKKLISSIKAEVSATEDWDLQLLKDIGMHIIDKSLYAISLCTQIPLTSSLALLLSTEKQGERNSKCNKAVVYQRFPEHDITLEAAWPELFIDHKGKYWEVPESISLDCLSHLSESGLRYRFGMHKSSGLPQALDSTHDEAPLALLPGVCAKAAFSYEKSQDLWRQPETEEDFLIETNRGLRLLPAYDARLKEPHATISGILGGNCEAWFTNGKSSQSADVKNRSRFVADLFGSICLTFQHGKFRKRYGDLTRIDARLDIASASALSKKIFNLSRSSQSDRAASSPRFNLILQQQVAGPIVFRVDSKFSLDSGPQLEDLMYSLNYSLKALRSGKVVAWYSPKRKEGMIELRLYEF